MNCSCVTKKKKKKHFVYTHISYVLFSYKIPPVSSLSHLIPQVLSCSEQEGIKPQQPKNFSSQTDPCLEAWKHIVTHVLVGKHSGTV